jgi:NTE family protein
MEKSKNISLALGGGSAWGFAHIGLLKIMEQKKIVPDEISACSMGAIILGLYASLDFDGNRLWDLFYNMTKLDLIKLFDPSFKHRPLFKGTKLKKFLQSFFRDRKIGDFEKEIKIIAATKEHNHKLITFGNNTKLIDAVLASSALPVFFPDHNGLIDGGFNTIVPVNILKNENFKIASNAYSDINYNKLPTWYKKKYYYTILRQLQRTRQECQKADLVIDYNMESIIIINFLKFKKIMEIGHKTAKKSI